jgi:uncharacterized membrane protein HdeD (DUF308 family)
MDGASLLIVRGLVGIVAGTAAVIWPAISLAVLVVIFGGYAIVDGATNLVLGVTRTPDRGRSWAHTIQGILGILAGFLALGWPMITALVLVLFIGSWAIVRGVLEIAAAFRLRREIEGEWMLALSGTMSLIFGMLVVFYPLAGAMSIAWLLGIYAAASGVLLLALGVRMRSALAA